MDVITIIYLVYTFIAFYFLFLFVLIYVPNRSRFHERIPLTKEYSLSLVIPCFNGSDTIGRTIEDLLHTTYAGLQKIYVVDDCSTDTSYEIIQSYAKKYPGKVVALQTPQNTGKASGAKNYGARFVKTELIGFTDDDSFVMPHALEPMMGYFDDGRVGAVTSTVLVHEPKTFMQKLQSLEYRTIAFSRKLLEFIDSIYVTPGPLAIYRKTAFDDVGGFDESNLTEDIEITWHMNYNGWLIKMSTHSPVFSVAPATIKPWFVQRIRWNVGGIQTIRKYQAMAMQKGMLGRFIWPFFVFSWVLGLFGFGFLLYRWGQTIALRILSTSYSIQAQTALVTLQDITIVPNVLLFFGIALLIMGLLFTYIGFFHIREGAFKNPLGIYFLMYSFVYLLMYPPLLIVSIYKYMKGYSSW